MTGSRKTTDSNPRTNPQHRPDSKAAKAAKAAKADRKAAKDAMTPAQVKVFKDWCIKAKHVVDEKDFDEKVGPYLPYIKVHVTRQKNLFEVWNFQPNCYGPDDRLFFKIPIFQKILTRNFCVIIAPWDEVFTLGGSRKFFDVDSTLKKGMGKAAKISASIKENGKFTGHTFIRGKDGKLYLVFASKNRTVVIEYSTIPDYRNREEFAEFCKNLGLNEILVSMLEAWMKIFLKPDFDLEAAICLGEEGWMVFGENLDGKHVAVAKENNTKVFSANKDGVAMENDQMREILGRIGYPLVASVDLPATLNIETMTIKDLIDAGMEFNPDCEGVVITIEYEDGTSDKIKFKFFLYKVLRSLRQLIIKYGWSADTLMRLHDLLMAKAAYHDVSATAAARYFEWATQFVTRSKNAGLSPKRVNFTLASWGEDVFPPHVYGMGATIDALGLWEGLYVLLKELGLEDVSLFKEEFKTLTLSMMPSVTHQDVHKFVMFLTGGQGSGKTTTGLAAAKLWNETYSKDFKGQSMVYIDQDMHGGDSAATRVALEELLLDPTVIGVIVGRTNHESAAFQSYVEIVRKIPNIGAGFVGSEPTEESAMLSAAGLVARTDPALVEKNIVTMGPKNMGFEEAMEVIARVHGGISDTFFGEHSDYPIIEVPTTKASEFRDDLLREWTPLINPEDQLKFLKKYMEQIATLRESPSKIAEALCEVFRLALSPSNPECAQFLRTYNIISHPTLELELSHVAANVDETQGRFLITKAMVNLSQFHGRLPKSTNSSGKKGKSKPDGKVNSQLHMTVHHPANGGSNPHLPDGFKVSAVVLALVIHKETGHAAYRVRPSIEVENKYPHFTVFIPKGRSAVQSNEFVGLDDDSVIVIPVDDETPVELTIENVVKK